ncbi:hypothetical protein PFISCL1PPCAC_24853, partial [Pristionchus fissidentatus]
LLPLLTLVLVNVVSTKDASTRLTRFLLSRHEPSAPPDDQVIVEYESQLIHIIALEEKSQTVKVLLHVTEVWHDATLRWNESDFEGVSETWLPSENVWIPDIIAFNMLQRVDVLSAVRSTVSIRPDGRVSFSYPQIVTFMCAIQIADFPFDAQKCTLEIASWGYSADKLRLRPVKHSGTLLQHYQENDEWALTNLSVDVALFSHEDNVVTEVRLGLFLQRKPLYFISALLLPSYIICILSVAGLFARFSTRDERQERFSLGVTATLTLAVLSLVVTEKVPHSSDDIPFLVLYFHFNTVLVTLATILTTVSMRISEWRGDTFKSKLLRRPHRDFRRLADYMDKLMCIFFIIILTIPFAYMTYRCFVLSTVF